MATTTYTEALITDEATDANSPINETLMQGIARSLNYVQDATLSAGANSERIGITLFNYAGRSTIGASFYARDDDINVDFHISIPSQYSGIDVAFKAICNFAYTDLDASDGVTLTVGTGSDQELEGGTAGSARDWSGTITPGSTGIVTCNITTNGVSSDEVLSVDALIIYIAST